MTLLAPRRKTRVLNVGGVQIGGQNPIRVQSMATADTRDPKATLAQIEDLASVGCEIVRIAVPDDDAAAALKDIRKGTDVPLVAEVEGLGLVAGAVRHEARVVVVRLVEVAVLLVGERGEVVDEDPLVAGGRQLVTGAQRQRGVARARRLR